jgi:uncharacterized protein (DUF2235 family)
LAGRLLGGINGWGLKNNILACYRFLVEHYVPGDELYFFGFSRGAYTARSLAGLVRNSGIVDRSRAEPARRLEDVIGEAWSLYRNRSADTVPTAKRAVDFRFQYAYPECRIRCIGVWDTVGALGIPIGGKLGWLLSNIWGFHDVTLSGRVDRAFQALAVDERRGPFVPTLWTQQPGAKAAGQLMEQVWFTGVHSDVGGGAAWTERGIATVTLRWMINRVMNTTGLDIEISPLGNADDVQVCVHDSMTTLYRLLNRVHVTSAIVRTIDNGLGQFGTRDDSYVTTESLHKTVDTCQERYESTAIPVIGRPYAPENVSDYLRRRKSEAARAGSGGAARPPGPTTEQASPPA